MRVQREDVLLETDQNASGGVATDAAISGLHGGKPGAEIFPPALGDRIAKQDHGATILLDALRPFRAALGPQFPKPIVTANWPFAGQASVGRGNFDARCRLGRGRFVLRMRCAPAEHEG